MQTVVVHDESLGKDFTIKVYGSDIVRELQDLLDPNNEDNPAVGSEKEYTGGQVTQSDRDIDLKRIEELIAIFKEPELTEAFVHNTVHPAQPTKKNGSYSKGRVSNHAQFDSFGVYWEDSYGDNTPAIRCRSTSDYEATLALEHYVVKY